MSVKNIKDIPFFSTLGAKEISSLEKISEIKTHFSGDTIFSEGDREKNIYFLLDGEVTIRKKISGGSKTIAIIKKEDIFGEMALFENAPRSASAISTTLSEVLEIDGEKFGKFLSDRPRESFGMLMKMIAVSSSRLRNMDKYFTTIYETARKLGRCANVNALAEAVLGQITSSLAVKGAVFYNFDIYNEEYSRVLAQGDVRADVMSFPASCEFMEKLKAAKWIGTRDIELGKGFWFINTVENEGRTEGFIGVVADADLSWEDKILVGTLCNIISPVMENLKMKSEEEQKQRLEEKKWQL